MDFALTEEQEAVRDLARQILRESTPPERLRELETSGAWYDMDLWQKLADANLLGLAMPEEVGGGGFGILELCLLLEEVGRHVAPVPVLPTAVLAGLPIAEFGTAGQRERWLPAAAEGGHVLTAALEEIGSADPGQPRTRARRDGAGWRLDGEKVCVPAAHLASCILVPARTEGEGVGVFLLEPSAAGVSLERQIATSGEPLSRLALDGAEVPGDGLLGERTDAAPIVAWSVERAHVGLAAIQLGVAEAAMLRTADYVKDRKQFGRPIGTFQGVALRAADAFIDVEAMRAIQSEAAWRMSRGLHASPHVAAARWWACRAGERVVHTAQHLHGGIGADLDYPIHRFFLWSKQNQVTLGGATRQLARLGALVTAPESARGA